MKFNFLKQKAKATLNHEGGLAFAMSSESELYSAVVTATLSDNFYEGAHDRLARIKELMAKVDAEYVAKLAVYARSQMNLRTVPLVLAVELAKQTRGTDLVSKAVKGVVKRADEIPEAPVAAMVAAVLVQPALVWQDERSAVPGLQIANW